MNNGNTSDDWKNFEQDGENYLAHRTLPLNIDIKYIENDNLKARENIKSKLDSALFLLSQTKIGRYLLDYAYFEGVDLVIDDKEFSDPESKVKGFVQGNSIFIDVNDNDNDKIDISLTLAHELSHIAQKERELFKKPSFYFRVDNAIRLEWAAEAEAFAASAQYAAELSVKDKNDPNNAWKSDVARERLQKKDLLPALVIEAVATQNEDDIFNGSHMAIQFSLFYAEPLLRKEYAKNMISKLNKVDQELPKILSLLSYRDDLQNKDLLNSFYYFDTPYLLKFTPEIDLLSGKLAAMPEEVKPDIISFYDKRGLSYIFEKNAIKKVETYKNEDIDIKIYTNDNSKPPTKRKSNDP